MLLRILVYNRFNYPYFVRITRFHCPVFIYISYILKGENQTIMSDSIFHIFSDERFLDMTVYQYGYEKCAPLHSYGPFVRNHYLFHYVISGKGTLSVTQTGGDGSFIYQIGARSGFLIEPGRINVYCADQKYPWEYVWVEFDGLRAKELMKEAGLSNDAPVYHPVSNDAADHLHSEMMRLTRYPDNSRPLAIVGQLYLILDALIQGSSTKKKLQSGKLSRFYAQEALSFIEQNYQLPITVEDMANRCNLDRSYFGKVFKDMIGQSPQDFLIRYRLSKATSLLVSTSLPIGDISTQVGYPNPLHFSRAFRNVYGISPRQYRQQNKLR